MKMPRIDIDTELNQLITFDMIIAVEENQFNVAVVDTILPGCLEMKIS